MKKLVLTLALTLGMALMGGCAEQVSEIVTTDKNGQSNVEAVSDNSMDSSVAATVNGTEISKEDFNRTYLFTSENYVIAYGQGDRAMLDEEINGRTFGDLLKEQVINSMIVDEIVGKKLMAEGVEATQAEIDQTYDNFVQYGYEQNEELKTFLADNNLDEKFLKDRIEKQIFITKFTESIRQPLLENIDFLSDKYSDKVAKVSARHILVATEDEAKAAIKRLNAGENFEELAAELSTDSASGVNGGDLGYFWRGMMIQEFEDVAFGLETGVVSEPVSTQFGYHIIKVEDRKTYNDLLQTPEGQAELETKKSEFVQAEFDDAYANAITDMMAENDIKINYNALGITPFQPVESQEEATTN